MKIINNKHTLMYNLPTIHSIQRYNGLCELTKCWFRAIKLFMCRKKCNWNTKYIIQHRIEHSQTTKSIRYNIHDTKSRELPICFQKVFKNLYWFHGIKLCECQKTAFGIRNTQYSIALSHSQTTKSTTYTIQSSVNCLNIYFFLLNFSFI